MSNWRMMEPWEMTSEELARQQQLQNHRPYDPAYPPSPPSYSPLSEADVQRIAEAVVARLRASGAP